MADMWSILPQGQTQTTVLGPGGVGFQQVWEVRYQITSGPAQGTTGVVNIPVEFYTPDYVKSRIDADVENISSVAGL